MISNDKELERVVNTADTCLQQIQDYLGERRDGIGRITLPKGYIRTAKHFKSQLSFVSNKNVRDNLAYALIQSDVYLWLINRTTLYGAAREMTIKSAITLMGSICETLAITGTEGIIGKRHSFYKRCDLMVDKGIIKETLRDELHWLWEIRSGIHIYEIDHIEYQKYEINDYNRGVNATRGLRKALCKYYLND